MPTESPAPTDLPVPTEAPVPTEPPVVEPSDILCQGVSFSYDAGIASDVLCETVPATGPAGSDMAEWEVGPEHLVFSFVDYALPETFLDPHIIVYPVGEFEALSEIAGNVIATLGQILADSPAVPVSVPILPVFNAGQLIRTQFAFLDFQNGSGVRFLTQLGQAYAPINNENLIYVYQGLTDDGAYYVSAILPVSHLSLSPDGPEIPGDDFAAFAENFETYAHQIEVVLDGQDASTFTPDLSSLDAMLGSLTVAP